MGWGGGPCDFSVSPSPFGLDFGTLDLDFGLGLDNSSHFLLRSLWSGLSQFSGITLILFYFRGQVEPKIFYLFF